MRNRTFAAVLILVAALSISAAPASHPERVRLTISGMYCASCADGIKAMLKRSSGIVGTDVNYERREAIVDYDGTKTTPAKIVKTVEKMGYKAAIRK